MKGTQADGVKRRDVARALEEVEEMSAMLDRRGRPSSTLSGILAADLRLSEFAPLMLYV